MRFLCFFFWGCSAFGRATFQGRKVAKVPRACGPGPGKLDRQAFTDLFGAEKRQEYAYFSRPLPLPVANRLLMLDSIPSRLGIQNRGAVLGARLALIAQPGALLSTRIPIILLEQGVTPGTDVENRKIWGAGQQKEARWGAGRKFLETMGF